jgi:hypothetical protein
MARGLKILIILVSLAMLAGIVLALALPKSAPKESEAQDEVVQTENDEEVAQTPGETSENNNGGQSNQTGNSQQGGGSINVNPGQGGGGSPLTVTFPDPPSGGDQKPPDGQSISGQWIADMTGNTYALKNCYLTLESNGTISVPSNYDAVFTLTSTQYQWQSGNTAFTLQLQAVLKLGNQTMVPLKIEMSGQVSGTLDKIEGTFTAVPQADAYAIYAQQGNFTMHH